MQSGKGELSIDGAKPFFVDFDLEENGRGYIAATQVQLTGEDRRALQLIVDSFGPRGGEFHVHGAGE